MPYLRTSVTTHSSPAVPELQRDLSADAGQLINSCNYSSLEGPLYTLAGVSSAASFSQLQRACKAGSAEDLSESETLSFLTEEQGNLTDRQPLVLQLAPEYSVMLKLPEQTDGPLLATMVKPAVAEQPVKAASSNSISSNVALVQQHDTGCSSPAGARVLERTPQGCRTQLQHARVLPSTDSMASITSVEAGQVLVGYEYIVPCRVTTGSSCSLDLCTADQASTQTLTPAATDSKVQPQLQVPTVGSSVPEGEVSGPLPPAAVKAPTAVQTISYSMHQSGSMKSQLAGPSSDPRPSATGASSTESSTNPAVVYEADPPQPGSSVSVSPSMSANLRGGSGPLLELQTLGSMLGGEGEQLLFSDDSTGAIEPMGYSSSVAEGLPAVCQAASPAAATAAACLQDTGPLPVVLEHGPVVIASQVAAAAVSTALPAFEGHATGLASDSAFISHSSSNTGARGTRFGFMQRQPAAAASQYTASGRYNAAGSTDAVTAAAAAAKLLAPSSAGMMHDSLQQKHTTGGSSGNVPLPAGRLMQRSQLSSAFSRAAYETQLPMSPSSTQEGINAALHHAIAAGQESVSVPLQKAELQSPAAGDINHQGSKAYEQWRSFRRPASMDCSRSLGSGRRRSSIELSMPWRSRLDAVIAQVTADDKEASAPAAAAQLAEAASGSLKPAEGAVADSQSQDLKEQPSLVPRAARVTSSSAGASSSAAPDAAVDDLSEAGSLLGDYGGASDTMRGGSVTLSELEAARSYGLEFDGAVLMQNADVLHLAGTGAQPWSEDMELLAAVRLQDQQLDQQLVQVSVPRDLWNFDSESHALLDAGHARHLGAGLSEQQQQQLADLGTPAIGSSLPLAVAGHTAHDQTETQREPADSSSVMQTKWTSASISKQQQKEGDEEGEQVVSPTRTAGRSSGEHDASGAADVQVAAKPQLVSFNSLSSGSVSSVSSRASAGIYARQGAGSKSTSAAYELFVRLHRARQTLDFAKRQAEMFAELDHAELGIWEALDMLNGLKEYEAALLCGVWGGGGNTNSTRAAGQDGKESQVAAASPRNVSRTDLAPDMSLKEHALQVAELCRLSFPDKPWMALVGLIHGLGKLLAHPLWGSQPQWAVAGESYPLGCRFAPQISHSEFFSANPDRRRRAYSTALGVYTAGCGLRNVYMSWGASEYLYMMLVLNQTDLPEEALFIIRYQRCLALTRPGGAYRQLMSDMDKSLLTLLAEFQSLISYKRVQLPPEALTGEQLKDHYDQLISRYLGEDKLFW